MAGRRTVAAVTVAAACPELVRATGDRRDFPLLWETDGLVYRFFPSWPACFQYDEAWNDCDGLAVEVFKTKEANQDSGRSFVAYQPQ